MRVLLVENAIGFGGSTVCARRILEACRQAGIEPFLLIAYDGRGLEAALPPEAVWRLDGYRLFRWGRFLRRWFARRNLPFANAVQPAVFEVVWRLLEWPCAVQVARRIRKNRIDLVHANNDLLNNRIAIVAGHLAGALVISHQRGWQWPGRFARRLSRWVSRFVAISNAVAEDLAKTVPNAARISKIYDGVDCDAIAQPVSRTSPPDRFGMPPQYNVIGMPAMLVPWKGQDLFLRAFARVAAKRNDVYALIVGDPPDDDNTYRESLEQLARRLGLADRVVFASFCEDLTPALACMDVVVHASLEPEPLGLVVLEAMAAGKAVVAADAGGIRETVLPGRTGLRYPPGDERALADGLEQLIENPSWRAALGHCGADHVRKTFNVRITRERIVDLYRLAWADDRTTWDRDVACPSKPCFS